MHFQALSGSLAAEHGGRACWREDGTRNGHPKGWTPNRAGHFRKHLSRFANRCSLSTPEVVATEHGGRVAPVGGRKGHGTDTLKGPQGWTPNRAGHFRKHLSRLRTAARCPSFRVSPWIWWRWDFARLAQGFCLKFVDDSLILSRANL
jgi:hypothetical protein